jgi:hypothetical protein
MLEKAIDTIFDGIQRNFYVDTLIIRADQLNKSHIGRSIKVYHTFEPDVVVYSGVYKGVGVGGGYGYGGEITAIVQTYGYEPCGIILVPSAKVVVE